MAASLLPIVEQPTGSPGAFQRSASKATQRRSISAVWGYSSLSIRLRSTPSSISSRVQELWVVWQKVARFCLLLPSSSSSSLSTCRPSSPSIPCSGKASRARGLVSSLIASSLDMAAPPVS